MTTLLILASILSQEVAPDLPLGSSADFQRIAYQVEEALSEGKFKEAEMASRSLPRREIKMRWSDSAVPAELKKLYINSRNLAIGEWSEAIPGIRITVEEPADIVISFQDTLPPAADSAIPAGATYFLSTDAKEPRLEGVLAVRRDNPPVTSTPRHIQNEVGYSIGAYLGLAKFPKPVGYMGRFDGTGPAALRMNPQDKALAIKILEVADFLRATIQSKKKITVSKPAAFIDTMVLEHEPVLQGDLMHFSLQVSNNGKSPLFVRPVPECSCISVAAPEAILPGATGLVEVQVDTIMVPGKFDKAFEIFTNDPDLPSRRVSIRTRVKPRYQFIRELRGPTIVMEEGGLKQDVYLAINQTKPFTITRAEIIGLKGIAEITPWEGSMADPDLEEPSEPRKGYKISFLLSPTEHIGRMPLGLQVTTDDKDLPSLLASYMIQWGIVASPSDLNFGTISQKDTLGYYFLSRPGKSFKVISVTSDNPDVTAVAEPFRNGDFRVRVKVSGAAPAGKLSATITATTDDPKQPKISVNLRALVK